MARKGRSAAGAAPSRPSSSHLHSDDEDVEGSVGGLQPQRDSDDEEEEQVFDLAGDYDVRPLASIYKKRFNIESATDFCYCCGTICRTTLTTAQKTR